MIAGVGLVLYGVCLFCDFISVFMSVCACVLFGFPRAQVCVKCCVFLCVNRTPAANAEDHCVCVCVWVCVYLWSGVGR